MDDKVASLFPEEAAECRDGLSGGRFRRAMVGVLISCLSLAVLIGGTAAAGALWFNGVLDRVDASITRFGDPFEALPPLARPEVSPYAEGAVNILLVGSDSRISGGDPRQWKFGAQRTDAIMMLHVSANRQAASIISIPRDSWVDVPGHGRAKINAAYSWGGPTLMIRTIENLTHVRIDHFIIVDFSGFVRITDVLGGVRIGAQASAAGHAEESRSDEGLMSGRAALSYVRQRYGLPNGDFDRIKRQQQWMYAVASKFVSRETLTSPTRLQNCLEALAAAVQTDAGLSSDTIRTLIWSARNLRPSDVVFMTAPYSGTGRSPRGHEAIVLLDMAKNQLLWTAVASDDRLPE